MTTQIDQMWAWAHTDTQPETPSIDPSSVIAVLVAHNGEQWLPRVLLALAMMDVRPGTLIAVDAESHDSTPQILRKAHDEGLLTCVVVGKADESFGANVQRGLVAADTDSTWIWLLHDDSSPEIDALEHLLIAAATPDEEGRIPDVVVPKLLHPKRRNHPDQMSAIGESITPTGMRVLSVESGDIDQHQVEPGRVLGASTAGLLVSTAIWQRLGGLDPAIPLFRDGVDFGWRANRLGAVVMTAPKAALRHVEAGRIGFRHSTIAPNATRADLLAGMRVAVIHSSTPAATIRRISRISWLKAVGFFLGKSPSLALSQLQAASRLRADRASLIARADNLRAHPNHTPQNLLPEKGWSVRHFFDQVGGSFFDLYHDIVDPDDDATGMIDELTGDDYATANTRSVRLLAPSILGMIVMMIVTLLASRHLLWGSGVLTGDALLAPPRSISALWENWLNHLPQVSGAQAPWLGLAAFCATVFFGHGDILASLLILGGPAFAGFAAYRFFQPIHGKSYMPSVMAIAWAVMLPVLSISGTGLIDATIVAIAIPALACACRRWMKAPTTGASGLRLPAIIAFELTILTSMIPALWVVALAVGVWMVIARRDIRAGLIVIIAPILTWLPWVMHLITDPGRLLTGIEPLARASTDAPSALSIVSGTWLGTPIWVALPIVTTVWILALICLPFASQLTRSQRALAAAVSVISLAIAIVVTRFQVDVSTQAVRVEPAWWILIGLFALFVPIACAIGKHPVVGVDDTVDDLASTHRSRILRAVLCIGVLAIAALGCLWWIYAGLNGLSREPSALPSYVRTIDDSPLHSKTLMIDVADNEASYHLVSADSAVWGEGERAHPTASEQANAQIAQVVQQFAQGQTSDDLAQRLSDLGIGHVWVRGGQQHLVSTAGALPGLSVAVDDNQTMIFTVLSSPGYVQIIDPADPDLQIYPDDGQIPSTSNTAMLVLNEPADSVWTARVGGTVLQPVDGDDWRQAFALNGATGTYEISISKDLFSAIWEPLCLLVLLVMAAPTVTRTHMVARRAQDHPVRAGGRRHGE